MNHCGQSGELEAIQYGGSAGQAVGVVRVRLEGPLCHKKEFDF